MRKITIILNKMKKHPVVLLLGIFLVLLSSIITIFNGFEVMDNFFKRVNSVNLKESLVKSLATEVDIQYFFEKIGRPAFVNKDFEKITEYIFVDKFYYIQALTDKNDRVMYYSVTTRDKRFSPEYEIGPFEKDKKPLYIKLGKSKFNELNYFNYHSDYLEWLTSELYAHNFCYAESYYFGNPGNYLMYYFILSESGFLPIDSIQDEINKTPPMLWEDEVINLYNQKIIDFRNISIINTYGVSAPFFNALDFFEEKTCMDLSVKYHQVRLLNK